MSFLQCSDLAVGCGCCSCMSACYSTLDLLESQGVALLIISLTMEKPGKTLPLLDPALGVSKCTEEPGKTLPMQTLALGVSKEEPGKTLPLQSLRVSKCTEEPGKTLPCRHQP